MREFFKKTWRKICDAGLWLKSKIKHFLIITGIVAVALAANDATTNEITPEKVATKYDNAQEIKSNYTLNGTELIKTDIKNAELDKYKGEPKDEVKVVIGDNTPVVKEGIFGGETETTEFKPNIELKRWNEVSFKIKPKGLDKVATKDKDLKFDKDKILFSTPKMSFEMYSVSEGEGGFKYIWFLNSKPESNIVEFDIESSGLDFFYQPPLTQEYQNGYSEKFKKEIVVSETQVKDLEGNVLVERPENVVGSYEVYHSTKGGMNDAWGKDYKVGKAFHIYRPHIIDASGAETWGILHIENGIYSVEIPQEFLDKAVYPIKSNDTIGYTDIGGSSVVSATFHSYSAKTTTVNGGTMTKIQIAAWDSSVNSGVKLAVYTDSSGAPNTLVENSYSGAITITRSGKPTQDSEWTSNTSVTGTLSASTAYWLGFAVEDSSVNNAYTSVTNAQKYISNTYANFPPSTVGATSFYPEKDSIYATYQPVAAGGSPYINRSQVIDEQ